MVPFMSRDIGGILSPFLFSPRRVGGHLSPFPKESTSNTKLYITITNQLTSRIAFKTSITYTIVLPQQHQPFLHHSCFHYEKSIVDIYNHINLGLPRISHWSICLYTKTTTKNQRIPLMPQSSTTRH